MRNFEKELEGIVSKLNEILRDAKADGVPMEDLKRVDKARTATVDAWAWWGRRDGTTLVPVRENKEDQV